MSAAAGAEQRFMAAVDGLDFATRDLESVLRRMDAWLADLVQSLAGSGLNPAGLPQSGELARQAHAINAGIRADMQRWDEQWSALAPARSLAAAFEDKAMLLVFGKFNAGKSSLCNFLAERFRQRGHQVQYFHVEAGCVQEVPQRLHEGTTETTNRLQGVCLGDRLVLLDTPGLHSASPENAALTQRFLDSADAVLWLTSSTSPGQVQELDELARELRRRKPLLPIVTRSDCIEEAEVDGEITKLLRNKSGFNRALQEADVQARGRGKLESMGVQVGLLKVPVSVSVRMAQESGQTDTIMDEAGIGRLYDALLEIVEPTLAYKQRKPVEVLLHHLEEQVLGGLKAGAMPALSTLRQALQAQDAQLACRQARMVQEAWRSVIQELPQWLEQHAQAQDTEAVCIAVARAMDATFAQQALKQLGAYDLPRVAPACIVLGEGVTYEAIRVSDVDSVEAVGYERLHTALADAVQVSLEDLAAQVIDACVTALAELDIGAERLQNVIREYTEQLSLL